jgi:hypothetical protein
MVIYAMKYSKLSYICDQLRHLIACLQVILACGLQMVRSGAGGEAMRLLLVCLVGGVILYLLIVFGIVPAMTTNDAALVNGAVVGLIVAAIIVMLVQRFLWETEGGQHG